MKGKRGREGGEGGREGEREGREERGGGGRDNCMAVCIVCGEHLTPGEVSDGDFDRINDCHHPANNMLLCHEYKANYLI